MNDFIPEFVHPIEESLQTSGLKHRFGKEPATG